jgi:uncharacterized protein (TIGR03435 family)
MGLGVVAFIWIWLAAPVSFEAASIRPARPAGPGSASSSRITRGRVEFHSVSLRDCIVTAYRVKDCQISAPGWLREQAWEIIARIPEGAPSSQVPKMLQALLEERFMLQVHREKKEFSGLALTVGNSGPKLKKSETGAPGAAGAGRRGAGLRMSTGPGGGRIIVPRATMASLASTISVLLGRPVTDETRISGTYDVTVECGPEELGTAMRPIDAAPDAGAGPAEGVAEGRASIFSSLRSLGLKLESRKILLDVIVVDHAERTPTEN